MLLLLRDENIVNTDTLFGMYASDIAYIALYIDCPNVIESSINNICLLLIYLLYIGMNFYQLREYE